MFPLKQYSLKGAIYASQLLKPMSILVEAANESFIRAPFNPKSISLANGQKSVLVFEVRDAYKNINTNTYRKVSIIHNKLFGI